MPTGYLDIDTSLISEILKGLREGEDVRAYRIIKHGLPLDASVVQSEMCDPTTLRLTIESGAIRPGEAIPAVVLQSVQIGRPHIESLTDNADQSKAVPNAELAVRLWDALGLSHANGILQRGDPESWSNRFDVYCEVCREMGFTLRLTHLIPEREVLT